MRSRGLHPMQGKVEVDETTVGGQEEGMVGRRNGWKKFVVFAIECNGKGVSRMYGRVIWNASAKEQAGS